jgi:hypothetical protein
MDNFTWLQTSEQGVIFTYAIGADGYYWGQDCGQAVKTTCKTMAGFVDWVNHRGRSNAARALRAIPSDKRAEQSKINGAKGGRPKSKQN